jgi:hypothetical protein
MPQAEPTYTTQIVKALDSFIDSNQNVALEGRQQTYSIGIDDYAPYATPTDIFLLQGSATRTIKITKIRISGASTAASSMDLYLLKRTADNTAGTRASQAADVVKHDTLDDAATAVPYLYSVIPTSLGAGKTFRTKARHYFSRLGAADQSDEFIVDFDIHRSKPIILRGVAEQLAINLGGAAVPSGLILYINVEWVEE